MGFTLRSGSRVVLTFIALLISAGTVLAQDAAPPHVSVVDGTVTLEREQTIESANPGVVLVAGDRLRSAGGRVEILFADGSALDVDENTTIDVQSERLLRLSGGRVFLTVTGASNPASAVRYQIDTPAGSVMMDGPGEFRVASLNGGSGIESELAVLRGRATFTNDIGSTLVRAGERSLAGERYAPSRPELFNSARYDAFDRWVSARRSDRLGTVSTQYLPRDLYAYSGTLDRYGSWDYEPSYGYVWYPTVAASWRPYYDGYWSPVPRYGWTWVGAAPWAWPTHHYGRWGYHGSRWFWAPGYHWSPAWVSWAYSPGYVSWCPLGYNNLPVFSISAGINIGWGGWVGVSYNHFSHRYAVPRYAVGAPPPAVRGGLVARNEAPALPPRAVPRAADARVNQAGLSAAGRGRTFTNADVDRRNGPGQVVAAPGARDARGRETVERITGREAVGRDAAGARITPPPSQDLFKRALPADARPRDVSGARTFSTGPATDSPGPAAAPAGSRGARDRRGELNGSAQPPAQASPLTPTVRPLSPTVRPLSPTVRSVQPDTRVSPYESAGTRPTTRDTRTVAPRSEPAPQPGPTASAPPPGYRARSAPRDTRPAEAAPPASRQSAPPAASPAPARPAVDRRSGSPGGGAAAPAPPPVPAQPGGAPAGARDARRR